MFAYGNRIKYDPTLVYLTSNFFVLCTNIKVLMVRLSINICEGSEYLVVEVLLYLLGKGAN